ncbi:hypothetical protein HN51_001673 [Arachis hypogaea]
MKVKDDRIILDKTLADQVSSWKSSKGLSDAVVTVHACSGETCSYYEIGDFRLNLTIQCFFSFSSLWSWIPPMSFWSVKYQDTVSIDFCHRLRWSRVLNSSKVVQLMRQNHLWGRTVLVNSSSLSLASVLCSVFGSSQILHIFSVIFIT